MADDTVSDRGAGRAPLVAAPGGRDFLFRQHAAANGMLNRLARRQLALRLAEAAEREAAQE